MEPSKCIWKTNQVGWEAWRETKYDELMTWYLSRVEQMDINWSDAEKAQYKTKIWFQWKDHLIWLLKGPSLPQPQQQQTIPQYLYPATVWCPLWQQYDVREQWQLWRQHPIGRISNEFTVDQWIDWQDKLWKQFVQEYRAQFAKDAWTKWWQQKLNQFEWENPNQLLTVQIWQEWETKLYHKQMHDVHEQNLNILMNFKNWMVSRHT